MLPTPTRPPHRPPPGRSTGAAACPPWPVADATPAGNSEKQGKDGLYFSLNLPLPQRR